MHNSSYMHTIFSSFRICPSIWVFFFEGGVIPQFLHFYNWCDWCLHFQTKQYSNMLVRAQIKLIDLQLPGFFHYLFQSKFEHRNVYLSLALSVFQFCFVIFLLKDWRRRRSTFCWSFMFFFFFFFSSHFPFLLLFVPSPISPSLILPPLSCFFFS